MQNELLTIREAPAPARPAPALARRAFPALSKTTGIMMTHTRNFFGNRFVYAVISQRAHGLSIGVNMNPDKFCNFDCVYWEVDRREISRDAHVDLEIMSAELRAMLILAHERKIRELPGYQSVPEGLLDLKELALSGDGEPTLCP